MQEYFFFIAPQSRHLLHILAAANETLRYQIFPEKGNILQQVLGKMPVIYIIMDPEFDLTIQHKKNVLPTSSWIMLQCHDVCHFYLDWCAAGQHLPENQLKSVLFLQATIPSSFAVIPTIMDFMSTRFQDVDYTFCRWGKSIDIPQGTFPRKFDTIHLSPG